MPELKIAIPSQFVDSMKKFMDEMDRFQGITSKITDSLKIVDIPGVFAGSGKGFTKEGAVDIPGVFGAGKGFQAPPGTSITVRFLGFTNQFPSGLDKLRVRISRSIERMVLLLGQKSRTFVNQMVMPDYLFNAIKTIRGMDSLVAALRFGFVRLLGLPAVVITVAKWIWDKSIQLMEYVQRDRIRALVQGTTIGGLRAFKAIFFNYPDDPMLMQTLSQINFLIGSRQSVAIWGTLGVKRTRDSIAMWIDTMRKARALLKQFPGQQIYIARKLHLPFSDPTVMAIINEKNEAKFERQVRDYLKHHPELELTGPEQDATQDFLEAKGRLWATIYSGFLKALINSGFIDGLTKLSQWMLKWIRRMERLYRLIRTAKRWAVKAIPSVKTQIMKDFSDFDDYLGRKTREMQDQLGRLTSRAGDLLAISGDPRGIRARIIGRERAKEFPPPSPAAPPTPFIRPAIQPKLGGPKFRGRKTYETVPAPVGPSYKYPPGAQQRFPPGPPSPVTTPGTGTIGWWTPDRANHAVERLMAAGLSESGAKALVARWAFEAPGGPNEVNPRSGAYGIAQWLGARKPRALESKGDFDKQIDWAIEELNTTEKRAGEQLRRAQTPEQGAAGASSYERAEAPFTNRTMDNYRKLFPGTTSPSQGNSVAPAGPGPTSTAPTGPAAPGATGAGAITAVGGGPPAAFIVHHTSGRGTVEGVQATLKQRGLGVQYVVDRDGKVYQIGGPGAANIMPESKYRQTPILGQGQPFLTNKNIVGVEVIALNDKDVTPAQIAAVKKLVADKYPNTPVYGHGEVNPGHKEADEGRTIVEAIRSERAAGGGKGSTTQPAAPANGKTMLFLHGMQSRYGDKSPAEIEAAARKYADAYGYKLEVIPESGDNHQAQLDKARERIKKGDVGAVFGFSAGGYNAAHLREEFPNLKYTITGAPSVKGDIALPNVSHMDLVPAIAGIATKTAPSSSAATAALGPTADQADRPYYYSGTIEMEGKEYRYGTGGAARGSAPYGTWLVDPGAIGTWGTAHGAIGIQGGHIWDPKLKDWREGIELHAASSDTIDHLYSAGCFAIAKSEYPAFKAALLAKIKRDGPQIMTVSKDGHVVIGNQPKPKSDTPAAPAAPSPTAPTPEVHQPEKKEEFKLPSTDNSKDSILKKKQSNDPPQHPEEDKGDKLTHPAVKDLKINNNSDATTKVTFNGKAGSNLADVQSASPMRRRGRPVDTALLETPPTDEGHATPPKVDSSTFSPALAEQRQRYLDELQNPAIRKRLYSFQEAEVGGQGTDAAVKWQETLFNRAGSRHLTLDQALHGLAGKDKGGYWPQRTLTIGSQEPTEEQAAAGELALRQVLTGSNRSALATGNASGTVSFSGGPETSRVVIKGKVQERFGIEGADKPWAAATQKALDTERAAAAALRQ